MTLARRSIHWSALLGATGLAFALIRRQRFSNATHKLAGTVVLITGGSRGLGFAIASELAAAGCRLALVARDAVELERAQERLLGEGNLTASDVFVRAADVTKVEEIREAVNDATAHFGRIDVVVNSAGVIMVGPVESQTLASFQQAMSINFFGALQTTLSVLPQMLHRGAGAVVNISSIGGKVAFPHLLPYVASKFALAGWSQGLHAELKGKGIHVMTVFPGVMRTGSHIQARFAGDAKAEYRWFASAASLPGTATGARPAARKIVNALARKQAEVAIGVLAWAASRLSDLAPESTANLLSVANEFLPKVPVGFDPRFWDEDQSKAGKLFQGSLPAVVEHLGSIPIRRFNQQTPPEADMP